MHSGDYRFSPRSFIKYKFFNSLFLGLSVGSIFTIYAPLKPSIYSIGGIFLAIGMLLVAKLYIKIMTIEYFYKISLFVELIILSLVLFYLFRPYGYATALFIYIAYQATFVFGSYLVRAETLIGRKRKIYTFFDTSKQLGYLVGLTISFCFYKILELGFNISQNSNKVYNLHFLLLICQIAVLYFLINSFRDNKKSNSKLL